MFFWPQTRCSGRETTVSQESGSCVIHDEGCDVSQPPLLKEVRHVEQYHMEKYELFPQNKVTAVITAGKIHVF